MNIRRDEELLIQNMLEQSKSMAEMRMKLNRSDGTIRKIIKRLGYDEDEDLVSNYKEAYFNDDGQDPWEIAFGCSHSKAFENTL